MAVPIDKILASPIVQKNMQKAGDTILKAGSKVIEGLFKAICR